MDPVLSNGMIISISILFIWGISTTQVSGADWSYKGDHGPSHWPDSYPKCGGNSQSPVDIKREEVSFKDLGKITFENYDSTSLAMSIKNNGHAAQVDITSGQAFISGSGLADDKYQLAQFHFHWGSDSNKGSEHLHQGRAFPAEMHLVHFNTKHSNLSVAADKEPHGLAVLGVFLEVGSADNTAFTTLIDALPTVKSPDGSQVIQPIRLNTLLPSNTKDFYRYQGSLTTPGCFESVQWTVFENPVQLSEVQFAEFRKLVDSHQDRLVDNFRPVLPLKDRTIYSTNMEAAGNANKVHITIGTSLLAVCLKMLLV